MQHVEVRRRFDTDPQSLWDAFTDHAGWKEWAGFSRSWIETEGSPDPNGAGCVRGFAKGPVKALEEILSFDPPKRMTYSVVGGDMPMRDHMGEVLLEPDGEGTLLVWRCRFDSRLLGLGGAQRVFIARAFRSALDGLARRHFPDRR